MKKKRNQTASYIKKGLIKMGLLTSVNNLSYEMQKEKELKLQEKKEKRIEKTKKENIKRYKQDLEIYLQDYFNKYFKLAGSCYIIEFYNRARKEEILQNFFNMIIEKENGFCKIPYKKELTQHFNNKYNIILNKCKKEQEQQEEYNNVILAKETEKEEKDQNKHLSDSEIITIFKTILYITCGLVFFPILFILLILKRLYGFQRLKRRFLPSFFM